MKDILDKLDNIITEGHLGMMADRVELDHEVQMARADLYKIAKYAIKLHEMMKNVSEIQGIEGWQQSKITKAADYLGSVYHNLDYEMSPMNPMNDQGRMDQMAFDLATEDVVDEDLDPNNPPKPGRKPKVDHGMERDKTKGLDPKFSKKVADQNKKAMEAMGEMPESKFSDWSKK